MIHNDDLIYIDNEKIIKLGSISSVQLLVNNKKLKKN